MSGAFRLGYRHVFAVIAAVVTVYFGVRTSGAVLQNQALAHQLAQQRGIVRTLEAQNSALADQLTYQQTPAYVEQVAREQLGLMKPGDHVIQLQTATASQPPAPAATPTPAAPAPKPAAGPPPEPNWRRWFDLFLNPAPADGAP